MTTNSEKPKLTFTKAFGNFKYGSRVACTSDGSIVVCDKDASTVTVHHKGEDGEYKQKLLLKLPEDNTMIGKLGMGPRSIDVHPDGRILVARFTRGLEIYSGETGDYQKTISIKPAGVDGIKTSTVYSCNPISDDKIILGDYERSLLSIVDSNSGKILEELKISIKPAQVAIIDENLVAVCRKQDSKVIVFNLKTKKEVLSFNVAEVNGVFYDKYSDNFLVTRNEIKDGKPVLDAGIIEEYNRKTGTLVKCIAKGLYCPRGMAFTPDGKKLVVGDEKTVKIYLYN